MKKTFVVLIVAMFAGIATIAQATVLESTTSAVTVVATNIVCNNETDLPNWGMGGHGPITSTTAATFVAGSDGACHVAPDWSFQWGDQATTYPGDSLVGPASGFTTFGPTDVNGVTSTVIPLPIGLNELHLREVLKDGYIPFTLSVHGDNSNDVSAEFYCANDAENYDNFDFITNPVDGQTYYCAAWNALKPVTVPVCTEGQTLVDNQCVTTPVTPTTTPSTGGGGGGGGGSTSYDYYGCTNTAATNFNSLANKDDGSCVLPGSGTAGTAASSTGNESGTTTGEVLGASTTTPDLTSSTGCVAYVNSFMRQGKNNDAGEVAKLQEFLNENMGATIPVTGYFGNLTTTWVKKYQVKFHDDIIKPWYDAGYKGKDIENGTGYVYKTTQRKINLSKCSALSIPVPDLSPDIW